MASLAGFLLVLEVSFEGSVPFSDTFDCFSEEDIAGFARQLAKYVNNVRVTPEYVREIAYFF